MEELINSAYTTISFTTQSGTEGLLITSQTNNNSIFLPAQENYWTREKNEEYFTNINCEATALKYFRSTIKRKTYVFFLYCAHLFVPLRPIIINVDNSR